MYVFPLADELEPCDEEDKAVEDTEEDEPDPDDAEPDDAEPDGEAAYTPAKKGTSARLNLMLLVLLERQDLTAS